MANGLYSLDPLAHFFVLYLFSRYALFRLFETDNGLCSYIIDDD